jgi:uncharacterized protein YdaU (DUF1376 family)
MSDTPFMQFWTGDFIGDTLHLTPKEVGQYVLLLMAMWRNGGALPSDPKKLSRIARGAISDAVMAYFDTDEEGIYQKRLRAEYEKARKKHSARVICGKAGGQAKALKNKEPAVAKANGSLKHLSESESEEEAKASSSSAKRKTTQRRRLPSDFQPRGEDVETLRSEGFSFSEIQEQLVRFRDYWAGHGKPMADWDATFRNWVRKSAEMGRGPGPPKRTSPYADAAAKMMEKLRHEPTANAIEDRRTKTGD